MHDLLKSPFKLTLRLKKGGFLMHALELLHSFFERSVTNIHKKRLSSLFAAVDSLLRGRLLTLTGLGRTMNSQAQVKHSIKRADRLLGNEKLHKEVNSFYQVLSAHILKRNKRPIILVDWSQLGENDKYYIINASIPYGGRSISIYQEVHHKSLYNTTPINKAFLTNLKHLIPTDCTPIIVTDAGTTFRCPWFKHLEKLKWDYVGRIRAGKNFYIKYGKRWNFCKNLYVLAKKQSAFLGKCILTKRSKFVCELVLAKRTLKKPTGKIRNQKLGSESNESKASRRARDPWLLATSLDSTAFSPNVIISIYKQRMQIEELFRDTKNQRIGFALKKSLSATSARLSVLLLIGTIANYIVFIIGQAARSLKLQYQFQSNTVKTRAVISIFNLGCQILNRKRINIPISIKTRIFNNMFSFMIHLENLI